MVGAGCRGAATRTIPPRVRKMVPNKHWNPLFAKERSQRYMKIDLIDHEFERKRARDELTPEEMKERMKKMGVEPTQPYTEKPFYISSTGAVLDGYIPAEGDGKVKLKTRPRVQLCQAPRLDKEKERLRLGLDNCVLLCESEPYVKTNYHCLSNF